MHVHTLSQPESTPCGRVQAGKTSPTKILHLTSLLQATQTAGENIAVLQRSSYQLADNLQRD